VGEMPLQGDAEDDWELPGRTMLDAGDHVMVRLQCQQQACGKVPTWRRCLSRVCSVHALWSVRWLMSRDMSVALQDVHT